MRSLKNNKGIALITALMFTLIILALIIGALSMVQIGTKASGGFKVYRNTVEAAYGGADIVMQDMVPRLFKNYSTDKIRGDYTKSQFDTLMKMGSNACIKSKRDLPNVGSNWSACSDKSINAKLSPDMSFQLIGTNGQKFMVYSKIVDTIPGVQYAGGTGGSGGGQLFNEGVVEETGGAGGGDGGSFSGNLAHYIYRVEVASEKKDSQVGGSKVSVLYEY